MGRLTSTRILAIHIPFTTCLWRGLKPNSRLFSLVLVVVGAVKMPPSLAAISALLFRESVCPLLALLQNNPRTIMYIVKVNSCAASPKIKMLVPTSLLGPCQLPLAAMALPAP